MEKKKKLIAVIFVNTWLNYIRDHDSMTQIQHCINMLLHT